MHHTAIPAAVGPDHEQPAARPACPTLCHTTFRPTHVGTDVAAPLLLVDPKTMLKSHSLNGHYAGIRPVRLPNRKLAWPIAEIEKLFQSSAAVTVKEAA
ncbi:hypothetical protein [Paraburkholderia nodosa]|uniref:hypothetical protein n=1 Tax=Paraburkholderia nodosa TaxID=392320 RepID=UPI001FDED1C3|nr:hypothetical protein [Paraburkholderia nodosa]